MPYRWRLIIQTEDGTFKVLDADTRQELHDYRANPDETTFLVRDRRDEPGVGTNK